MVFGSIIDKFDDFFTSNIGGLLIRKADQGPFMCG